MMKIFHLRHIVRLVLSTSLLSGIFTYSLAVNASKGESSKDFLKKYSSGLDEKGTEEGNRAWYKLQDLFKSTPSAELLSLAFKAAKGKGIRTAEYSMELVALLKSAPGPFMNSSVQLLGNNLSCLFQYIIPQTQFITFDEIKDLMNKKTDQTIQNKYGPLNAKNIEKFKKEATSYFQKIKKGQILETDQDAQSINATKCPQMASLKK